MREHDPVVALSITMEMPSSAIPELMRLLGAQALGEVRFGEQRLGFVDDLERKELRERVSVQAARNFYTRLYQDETPSPLATTTVRKIARLVSADEREVDIAGTVISLKRTAWDREVDRVFSRSSQIKLGPKAYKFLKSFHEYLPDPATT